MSGTISGAEFQKLQLKSILADNLLKQKETNSQIYKLQADILKLESDQNLIQEKIKEVEFIIEKEVEEAKQIKNEEISPSPSPANDDIATQTPKREVVHSGNNITRKTYEMGPKV